MENNKQLKPFWRMRGGINFSGALEGGGALKDDNAWIYQKKYYEIVKNRGFDHIRLPLGLSLYADDTDYTLNPAYLEKVKLAVDYALESGLMIVLDHHRSCYNTNTEKFMSIWEQVAEYFKDYPEELMFELVNEPVVDDDKWLNQIQAETVKRIRKTNPTRGIAIACNQWNGSWKIVSVDWDLFDEDCFLSVHNYYTLPFTRQGRDWKEPKWPGYQQFTRYIAEQITQHLELASDFQKKYHKKIWISECGLFLRKCDPEEVTKYIEHFTKECARFNLPYAWWEFCIGFGIYNMPEERWKEEFISKMTIKW